MWPNVREEGLPPKMYVAIDDNSLEWDGDDDDIDTDDRVAACGGIIAPVDVGCAGVDENVL